MTDLRKTTSVLVVDDEKLIRLTLCAKLKKAGYDPVAVESVEEAVTLLKKSSTAFCSIISDIMMGDMDGFVFRDIVRGFDNSMPFFFMTALDPEEGSGFLKRIISDPMSYYLPKSAGTDVLIERMKRVVASRRIGQFIERQVAETRQSLALAAHIQHSLLPPRAAVEDGFFYTSRWLPKETISGDLFEAAPCGDGRELFIVGDIQGHGTSAALAMTAVQSFLKNISRGGGQQDLEPQHIANLLQRFFRANLAEVSYMTAVICIYDWKKNEVSWITCGAPGIEVVSGGKYIEAKPWKLGGLPIGLMPDTVYGPDDVVQTKLPEDAVCIVYTDGITDLSRDAEGLEKIPPQLLRRLRAELAAEAVDNCSRFAIPHKTVNACEAMGYGKYQDDITEFVFGPNRRNPEIFETSVRISPAAIDAAAREAAAWCSAHGWSEDIAGRIQLVIEEKLMNVHDHGFDDRDRMREVAGLRLRRRGADATLTVWDAGTPEPSLEVAAGSAETAFELANRAMNNHGRGRLMLREICRGVERKRFGNLNETVYHVPFDASAAAEGAGERK